MTKLLKHGLRPLAISCLSLTVAFVGCTYDENRLRPQVDGTGGSGGTGGTTGGAGGSLDAQPGDAPGADVADVPIGGSGGSGGVGGTGGAGGSGGAGGFDGGRSDVGVPDVPSSGGIPGTGGTAGGGVTSTGGVTGTGGTSGTGGGATSTGGAAATGGTSGTGGATGTGGASGTGGAVGTGGTTAACQEGATECSGNGVRTCASGQWSAVVACGPRQTCTGPAGIAKCTCNVDPVCSSVGGTCTSASVLANCAQDAQACSYQSSATTCTNGACFGPAGSASCCTNACTAGTTCLSGTSLQTCAVGGNGCTSATTTTCTNGACFGPAGSASCCTNACTAGTTCLSGTSLQTCAVGANGCTAFTSSTCSSGLVCERYPPAACLDPTWAEWPMPNGQADVTAGAPNLASYTDNGDGTVTDNVTGLMWQQAVSPSEYSWAAAKAYCPTLTLAGHNDWRLPTRIELASLVDFGRSSPAINTTYFPSTPSIPFWSSSPLAGSSSGAWVVLFGTGFTDSFGVSNASYVRCVR